MSRPRKILVIVGPTAVGKSALAVRLARANFRVGNSFGLARRFHGEVISADSRQVYRGLDIGTGKITKREMRGIAHHLLDVANPRRQFSVVAFQKLAREKIAEIFSRGHIPIICGGSGLYSDSLLGSATFPEVPPNPKLRKQLQKKSAAELFALLTKLDPRRARAIDRYNPRRLMRAIEIAEDADWTQTKRGLDADKKGENNIQPYDILWIGLILPRDELKEKVSIRLFARIRKYNMIQEVKRLHRSGLSWKRMEELGLEYRYVSRYVRGRMTQAEMIGKLRTEIYRYAKRQMTWFRRNKEIEWFSPREIGKIENAVCKFISG